MISHLMSFNQNYVITNINSIARIPSSSYIQINERDRFARYFSCFPLRVTDWLIDSWAGLGDGKGVRGVNDA